MTTRTVTQLKAEAKAAGHKGFSKLTKAALIALLNGTKAPYVSPKSKLASRILCTPVAQGADRDKLIARLQMIHAETKGTYNLGAYFIRSKDANSYDITKDFARMRFIDKFSMNGFETKQKITFERFDFYICRALGVSDHAGSKEIAELAACYLTKTGTLKKKPTR
jgi:hypothetical protein